MADPALSESLSELELRQLIARHECDLLLRKPATLIGESVTALVIPPFLVLARSRG